MEILSTNRIGESYLNDLWKNYKSVQFFPKMSQKTLSEINPNHNFHSQRFKPHLQIYNLTIEELSKITFHKNNSLVNPKIIN